MAHSRLALTMALITPILSGGCATQAQRQFQAMKIGNQEHAAQYKACAVSIYNSPEYALLRPHLPTSAADATLQQLSDPSFATPSEVETIFSTHPKFQQC